MIKEITLDQSIQNYIKWKSTHIESAHSRYQTYLNKFRESVKHRTYLRELNEMDIADFQNQLKEESYSDATIAFIIRLVRNFLQYWQADGIISVNPERIRPIKFTTPEQPVVDEADFKSISSLLDERNLFDLQRKLVIHLLWDTGMRVSELTDMKIGNIRQSEEGMRTAQIETKKAQRYDLIMWSKSTEELLLRYLGWRLCQNQSTDHLFIRTDGLKSHQGIATRTVERWVRDLAVQAGIRKPITPHSFRHGKAHHILDSGGTAFDVQTILRHRNMNSSLNYMRLNERRYIKRASQFCQEQKEFVQPKFNIASMPSVVYNAV